MGPLQQLAATIVDDLRHQRAGDTVEAATALLDDFVAKVLPGATRPGDQLLGLRTFLLNDPERGPYLLLASRTKGTLGLETQVCALFGLAKEIAVEDLTVPVLDPAYFAEHLGARPIDEAGFPSYDPTGSRFLGGRTGILG
jgi:hypothetical protein